MSGMERVGELLNKCAQSGDFCSTSAARGADVLTHATTGVVVTAMESGGAAPMILSAISVSLSRLVASGVEAKTILTLAASGGRVQRLD